jgi:hypothetical protein
MGRDSVVVLATRNSRTRDRIPLGARFSNPVRTGPGVTQSPVQLVTSFFPGRKALGAWPLPPTPNLASRLKKE